MPFQLICFPMAPALDWLMQNATRPAVATLSLGIPIGAWSQSLETAVQQVLASGVLVVVAEGDSLKSHLRLLMQVSRSDWRIALLHYPPAPETGVPLLLTLGPATSYPLLHAERHTLLLL